MVNKIRDPTFFEIGDSLVEDRRRDENNKIIEMNNFISYIIKKIKNNKDTLWDFSISDNEFKEGYGYTKEKLNELLEKL